MLAHWLEQEGKREMLTNDELGLFIYLLEVESDDEDEEDVSAE